MAYRWREPGNHSSDRNALVSPNNTEHAARYLRSIVRLQYKTAVDPDKQPRDVDQVWREIVCLFDPLKKQNEKLVCPEELKDVMKKEHESEQDLNTSLFNALRKALADEQLIDECKNVEKRHLEPIVFKSQKRDLFAVGIDREVNGEQTDGGSDAPFTTKENLPFTMKDNLPSRESESGLVAKAKLDHGVCLLYKGKAKKWKVAHCLSAIELKLVGSKNECRAIQQGVKGKDNNRWLNLGYWHGAVAQVMLYTMCWVVASLAKIGQLKEEIPWAVVVGKRKPTESKPKQSDDPTTDKCAKGPDESQNKKQGKNSLEGQAEKPEADLDSHVAEAADDDGLPVTSPRKRKPRRETPSGLPAKKSKTTVPQTQHKIQANATAGHSHNETATQESHSKFEGKSEHTGTTQSKSLVVTAKPRHETLLEGKSSGQPPCPVNRKANDKISSETNSENPFLTMSKEKSTEATPSEANQFNHWVTGNIFVPPDCGGEYKYAVTGFEQLSMMPNDDESAKHALSVYFDTILAGLRAAKNCLDALRSGTLPESVATSGKDVMVGSKKLENLKLCGRAGRFVLVDPALVNASNRNLTGEWIVNQGEIFKGTLNIHDLTREVGLAEGVYLPFSDENVDVRVAVKVSSVSVHKYLTSPEHSWHAMHLIWIAVKTKVVAKSNTDKAMRYLKLLRRKSVGVDPAKEQQTRQEIELAQDELAQAEQDLAQAEQELANLPKPPKLSDVLLAVHARRNGIVTIMKDLTVEGYDILRPSLSIGMLPALWKAFVKLLEDVLIPMANVDVIHPDLRPGYNETANILFKMEDDEKASMKLIDFESLSSTLHWIVPEGFNRSLYIESNPNAHVILWKQCLAIAYAWKNKKSQSEMVGFDFDEVERKYRSGDDANLMWMNAFYIESTGPPQMTEVLLPKLFELF